MSIDVTDTPLALVATKRPYIRFILVYLETRRPTDLLADRSADSFASWLKEHPTVELISFEAKAENAVTAPGCDADGAEPGEF